MGTKTKRFKAFDRMFKNQLHQLIRGVPIKELAEAAQVVKQWPDVITPWDHDTVSYCVYEAPDHDDWQLFRVSLKGLSTAEKLYMLKEYYKWQLARTAPGQMNGEMRQMSVVQCRIDNYLGALRRGGQLDMENRIMK